MNRQLFILSILLLSFAACKKEEQNPTKDLLVQHKWQLQTSEEDGTSVQLQACATDDYFDFSDNGTGTFDEGATKCDTSDPQYYDLTWSLSGDQKILTYTIGSFALAMSITSINSNALVLEYSASGKDYKNTYVPVP